MKHELFDQELRLSYNNAGKEEELCIVIDEYSKAPYFVIRCKNKHGWKMYKNFYDIQTAKSAWQEIKSLPEIE